MRAPTSLAALVTLVAVASTAAPIGAPASSVRVAAHARSVVPVSGGYTKPDQDMSYVVPNAKCGDCHEPDMTMKVSLDGVQPVVDDANADLKGMGGNVLPDGVKQPEPVHASIDIGDESKDCDDAPAPESHQAPPPEQPEPGSDSNSEGEPHDEPQPQQAPSKDPEPQQQQQQQQSSSQQNESGDKPCTDSNGHKVDASVCVDMQQSPNGTNEVDPYLNDVHEEVMGDNKDAHAEAHEATTGAKTEAEDDIEAAHDVDNGMQSQVASTNEDLHDSGNELGDGMKAEAKVAVDDVQPAVDATKDASKQVADDSTRKIEAAGQELDCETQDEKDHVDGVTVDVHDGKHSIVRRSTSRTPQA